jgi:hypothetical protein
LRLFADLDYFADIEIQTYNLTDDQLKRLIGYQNNNFSQNPLMFDSVKDDLNGQGRLIIYTALAKSVDGKWDPTNFGSNQIDSMMEGNFVKGDLNGFGRNMYQAKTAGEYKCKYGFFKNNDLEGKGIYYTAGQSDVIQGKWVNGGETPSDPTVIVKDFIYWN